MAVVRVTVRNDTESALSFSLSGSARQGGYRETHTTQSQHPFAAPSEQTSYHTLLIPMCSVPKDSGGGWSGGGQGLSLKLTGATSGNFGTNSFDEAKEMAAFTKSLTTDQIQKFNSDTTLPTAHIGRPREFAVQFEHTFLPSDWRALSGFDYVSFATNEWLQLTAAVRASVLQWVELGGTLTLYTQSKEKLDQLQIRLPSPSQETYGLGRVRLLPWDGLMLRQDHLREAYPANGKSKNVPPKSNLADARGQRFWTKLQNQFGERSFAAWQIGIILVLFGLLVGPINLFYFAKAGQRHRLFFTTPIISLGASLLLIVFILFQDGTGGSGVQTSLVYVNPNASTVSIHQEQLSRTGVLFSSGFQTDEPAVLTPVLLSESRWTRLKPPGNGSPQSYNQADAKSFAGDWFQSRSEQAQIVEMVRSSRGRIELASAPDQPPVLRSSFGYALEQLFYVDQDGKLWRTNGSLATGGSATLAAATESDLEGALGEYGVQPHLLLANPSPVIPPLPKQHFFAFTRDAKAEFIPTLISIKWSQRQSFVWGPIATTAPLP